MKDIAYYYALPDSMHKAELYSEFLEVVNCFERLGCTAAVFLNAVSELSERQWHTYTILPEDLRRRVEVSLLSCWDGHDLETAEKTICVAAQLGLEGLFTYVCSQSDDSLSPEVALEIRSALSEFGCSISDPFSGIR
ncbi:hypothetical protein J3P89_07130 [Pseudomonas sp. Z1-14]|uniref:hypothetical protein n=1 Tax=unclassified Pseudomonas TaxID=196821 RepID=UPI003DA97ED9